MEFDERKRQEVSMINDKAFDLLAEMVNQEEAKQAICAMEEADAVGISDEEQKTLLHMDSMNYKRIEAHFRKQKTTRFFTHTLPRIAQVAAIVIAVIAVTGTVAIATSQTVRIKVMQLLYTIEKEYTAISLVENPDAAFDIPEQWQGAYFPSFIPQGFTMAQIESNELSSHAVWLNDDETQKITFSIMGEGAVTHIDTENAVVIPLLESFIEDGITVLKNENVTIAYRVFDKYIIITSEGLDSTSVESIYHSVQRIK